MSLDPETRKTTVQYRIEKALNTWDDAAFIIQAKRWNTAANRMYYAVFHAASALLIAEGIPANTHKGFMTQVSAHLVNKGIITKEEGKLIRTLFGLRHEDDYEDFIDATEQDINNYKDKTKELIDKLIKLNKYK